MVRWTLRHFTFGFLCSVQAFVEATNVECNFEDGVCSFSSDCKSGDCFAPVKARLADEGPAIDHTTGEGDGWYARAQFSKNGWPESVARLGLSASGPFCFSAWLHASGLKLPRVEMVSRQEKAPWYADEDEKERIFYRAQFSHSGLWQKVLYNEERQVTVQLEIRAWHFTDGSVAVDDLNVTGGLCPADPEDGSCSFDRSTCGYESATAGTGNMWKRIVPGRSASRNQAVTLDHTTDTIRGGYINLLVPANTTASRLLSSPLLNSPNTEQRRCLRFFYYALRSEPHSGLELVLSTNLTLADDLHTFASPTRPLWAAHNYSLISGAWMPVDVSFMASEAHQIHFRGYVERARNSSWFCALDDIEVYTCADRKGESMSCKFDGEDLCNWTSSHELLNDTTTWKLSDTCSGEPHLPEQPHSECEGGFVYAENKQPQPVLKAVLTSPSWESGWVGGACLTFWHLAVFERPGSCNLTVSGGPGHVWWSSTHELTRAWKPEVIHVWLQNDQEKFSLEASLSQALIAIDDIDLSFGACPSEQRGLSCDFEQGPCTWTNPVGKKRTWEWLLRGGNLNTGIPQPPRDHTLSTPEGSFMLVSGREMQFGGTAELQSEVVDLRSPGTQCLDFWYAAYATRKDRLQLKVMVQKSTSGTDVYREQVWYHKGGNVTTWQLGRVKVPRGHRVAFEAAVLKSLDGYVALDDISIYINENCLTVPEEAKTGKAAYVILECLWNSPSGCLWFRPPDFMDSWKLGSRSPPKSALAPATSPDGRTHDFVYASCHSTSNASSTSLISPGVPQQPTPVCLRFAYHMFGPGSRELQLVLRTPRQASPADRNANRVLFAARGRTVADRWYDVARTVSVTSPSTALVFSVPSGKCKQGDIFLSNIHVTPGACNEANDGRGLCDFEQDICNWENNGWSHVFTGMNGDMANASRHSGPSNSLGYLQLAWFRGAANRAFLSSPLWSGNHRPRTIELWYYAKLTANCSLEVHLEDKNGSVLTRVWTLPHAAPVRTWSLARAEITLQATDFRVVIKGTLNPRSNNGTVIGVDNVRLDLARPSHVADCNFDQDLCGYVSSFDSSFRWLVGSARVFRSQPGSQVSHALFPSGAGGSGRFAYADATLAPTAPSTITLRSAIFDSNGNATLFMRYFRNGTAFQTFQVHQLLLLSSGSRRLLLADLSSADQWQEVTLSLHPADESQLEISLIGSRSPQGQGLAAIARIRVTPGSKDVSDRVGKATVDLSCDFEEGSFCLWKPDVDATAQLRWSLNDPAKGRPTIPLFDHTTISANGSFIFAENNGSAASVARIKSTTFPLNSTSSSLCLSFWYFTLTDRNSSLNVTIAPSSSDPWFQPGARVVTWVPAQAHFSGLAAVNEVQVVIEASITTGLVALDDLSMTVGSCPTPSLCTFEGGTDCGHAPDMNNARDWTVRQGSYLEVPDHTTGSLFGHYLYLNTTSASQGQSSFSRLYLPVRNPTAGACLSLWWRAHGEQNKINVYRFVHGAGLRELVHSLDTEETLWWYGHSVNITSDEPYQVVLEALIPDIATTESGVLLDDIELLEGKCPNQNACTFEGPTCLEWQDPQEPFATGQWKQQRAGLSVYPRDHTTGTAQGHYMRFSAETRGQLAVLAAGESDGPRCASLWYQLSDDLQGMVLLLGPLRLNETTPGQWQPAQFSLTREHGSIIAISGSNPKAFALIDDLMVEEKDCSWQGVTENAVPASPAATGTASTAMVPASTTTTPLSALTTPSKTTSRSAVTTPSQMTSLSAVKNPSQSSTRMTPLPTATPTAATSSPRPTCGYGMFSCRDGKNCIPALLLCDGVKDCLNGADEMCGGVGLCPDDHYHCRQPPKCIPKSNLCDGHRDCTDGSDEILCDKCPSYFCLNGGNCSLHHTSRAPGCTCEPGFYGNRCQVQPVEKPSHNATANAAGGTTGWAYIAPVLVLLILGFTAVLVFFVRRKRANDALMTMNGNRQVVVENPIYGLTFDDEDTTSRHSRQSVESWFSRTFRFSKDTSLSTSEC
ncbi:MAM and LDL-receptor class A domain-containing protein 2-like [Haemaphysalis longicornis]